MKGSPDVLNTLRAAFAGDPRFGSARIRVSWLDDSTLAFEGQVPDLAAKEAAGDLARRLAPGCEVDNALTVAGAPPDAALTRQAQAALAELGLPASVGVEVRDGIAWLRGVAPTLALRRAAMQAVAALKGVAAVRFDQLLLPRRQELETIGPEQGMVGDHRVQVGEGLPIVGDMDDASLANAIEAKLKQRGLASAVATQVRHGTARLFGFVRQEAQRQEAEEACGEVPGVVRVVNLLVTQEGTAGQDEALAERIRHAFTPPEDHVSPVDVKVLVVEDAAYLFGTVDVIEQAMRAEAIAQATPGIRYVYSQLTVSSRHPRPASGPGRAPRGAAPPEA